MGTNFYAKVAKRDIRLFENEFQRYLMRFCHSFDFQNEHLKYIEAKRDIKRMVNNGYANQQLLEYLKAHEKKETDNTFVRTIRDSILQYVGNHDSEDFRREDWLLSEEVYKQLTYLSMKNPGSIKAEDFDFIKGHIFNDKSEVHIGKRSAAGRWCSHCDISLMENGVAAVHSSYGKMLDTCPICGAKDDKIIHVCSFTWQYDKEFWENIFGAVVETEFTDEYGIEYDISEVQEEIDCRIQMKDEFRDFC